MRKRRRALGQMLPTPSGRVGRITAQGLRPEGQPPALGGLRLAASIPTAADVDFFFCTCPDGISKLLPPCTGELTLVDNSSARGFLMDVRPERVENLCRRVCRLDQGAPRAGHPNAYSRIHSDRLSRDTTLVERLFQGLGNPAAATGSLAEPGLWQRTP